MNPYLIIQPVITEKTLMLAQKSVYTFRVDRGATKQQIKGAVQTLYDVEVMTVNTVVGHNSHKATGRKRLKRVQPKVKKAVVTLKPGQKIELFDVQGANA